jgi:GT2 family glycosyltransferase
VTCLVSAVVLAFGKEELLRECLRALVAAFERVAGEAELLVVGNALSDEGRRGLRDTAPDAVLIEPGRNLGFAAGVTVALAQARGEWIALVNDDCVVEPEALAELLAAGAQGSDVGSVAAQVRFVARPEIINSAGLEIDELGIACERLLGASVTMSAPDTGEVFQ